MTDPAEEAEWATLLERLQQAPDDEAAWCLLYQRSWPFVLALGQRYLPRQRRLLDAEDVAQEVYLKFARYWHERRPAIRDRNALFSLLAVMTRRLAGDAQRWLSRGKRAGHEQPFDPELGKETTQLAEVDMRDLLDRVCQGLDAQEHQVLELRLQGYSLAEIAAHLQTSERTVERKLHRLREHLGPHLGLEPESSSPGPPRS